MKIATREAPPIVIAQPTGLRAAREEMAAKRKTDLIRFRTCCADPRASK